MNVRALVIMGITSLACVAIPTIAVSKPETSSERINLEVNAPQNAGENNNQAEEINNRNDRIEVNSEEINSQSNERLETLELDRTKDNCHTARTNQSSPNSTFEGECTWDWKF